jgi:hypothetical protein
LLYWSLETVTGLDADALDFWASNLWGGKGLTIRGRYWRNCLFIVYVSKFLKERDSHSDEDEDVDGGADRLGLVHYV